MADRVDPYGEHNFVVELNGITRAGFRECAGPDSSHSDITLSRGFTIDAWLWEWRQKTRAGTVERHDVSISMLDENGDARITWNLFECWPSGWSGPSLNAVSDEIAIERLTLSYERIELDQRQ
jgi:phage tail-like protein